MEVTALVSVLSPRPLVVHFSLHHPPESGEPTLAPRALGPPGAFAILTVRDADGVAVFETDRVKYKPKLDPAKPESYVILDPGSTYGAVWQLDAGELAPGTYSLEATYDSGPYTGPPDHSIGPILAVTSTTFVVS